MTADFIKLTWTKFAIILFSIIILISFISAYRVETKDSEATNDQPGAVDNVSRSKDHV